MEDSQKTKDKDNNSNVLLIQNLHKDVTQKDIFQKFKKFGYIKSLEYNNQTNSAKIEFSTSEQACKAKNLLNNTMIFDKEINICHSSNKQEFTKPKNFNLLITNVPLGLETTALHNFMSKYGEISFLVLKKNEQNQNLGYGYVQFKTEEGFNKILDEQEKDGEIKIQNLNISFSVQKFLDKDQKQKINTIEIKNLLLNQVLTIQNEAQIEKINEIYQLVKDQLGIKKFQYTTEYNETKKAFFSVINFKYNDADDEENIYKTVKTAVLNYLQELGGHSSNQTIFLFRSLENSERNLFFQGVKADASQQDISDWIKNVIDVTVPIYNIKILNKKNDNSYNKFTSNNVIVYFESQAEGQKLMIFCASQYNKNVLDQIFDQRRRVTLYLQKEEQQKVSKSTQLMNKLLQKQQQE